MSSFHRTRSYDITTQLTNEFLSTLGCCFIITVTAAYLLVVSSKFVEGYEEGATLTPSVLRRKSPTRIVPAKVVHNDLETSHHLQHCIELQCSGSSEGPNLGQIWPSSSLFAGGCMLALNIALPLSLKNSLDCSHASLGASGNSKWEGGSAALPSAL